LFTQAYFFASREKQENLIVETRMTPFLDFDFKSFAVRIVVEKLLLLIRVLFLFRDIVN
jgi:hypothetical protein